MALIKCKECEKEYSDTLDVCPHCGYDNSYSVKEWKQMHNDKTN